MIHYFVHDEGMHIEEKELPKGACSKKQNPHMYLTRKGAVRAAMKELAFHIKDCMAQFKEYKEEL
jgi:hypothetical protein